MTAAVVIVLVCALVWIGVAVLAVTHPLPDAPVDPLPEWLAGLRGHDATDAVVPVRVADAERAWCPASVAWPTEEAEHA